MGRTLQQSNCGSNQPVCQDLISGFETGINYIILHNLYLDAVSVSSLDILMATEDVVLQDYNDFIMSHIAIVFKSYILSRISTDL